MLPPKLRPGDTARIIAPSGSFLSPGITEELLANATKALESLGLDVTRAGNLQEIDDFGSSAVQSRLDDLHGAFENPSIKLVICIRGGFNSNQLLDRIDYELITKNPKILCGFSDITALAHAIYVKTGLVTYSGPNVTTLGRPMGHDYTINAFRQCLFSDEQFDIEPSEQWFGLPKGTTDYANQTAFENDGLLVIHPGQAEGTLLGANVCTLNMLQGTPYFPDLTGSVLFLEDDYESKPHHFDSHLQSLILQPSFKGVKGLVIGRFETQSGMTDDLIRKSVEMHPELKNMPVIANVDFGHTLPMITFPIGGRVRVEAMGRVARVTVMEH